MPSQKLQLRCRASLSDTLPLAFTATDPGALSHSTRTSIFWKQAAPEHARRIPECGQRSPCLHGYPPRSFQHEEGGAGEEGPLPDAWAGPEVDSVGKMYIEDFGANRQKPPCTPPKMSPNQGPRNEGPKPEAEQHALLDKQRIRFPPCARQNRRHHPTPNVEAARFKTNKPHYASGVYHLQCCPSWVTSHKLGIYPLDWDWLWSSFRRAAARKPLRDPRWLPARWLLGKMAPS
jgi:hypothetical protein